MKLMIGQVISWKEENKSKAKKFDLPDLYKRPKDHLLDKLQCSTLPIDQKSVFIRTENHMLENLRITSMNKRPPPIS